MSSCKLVFLEYTHPTHILDCVLFPQHLPSMEAKIADFLFFFLSIALKQLWKSIFRKLASHRNCKMVVILKCINYTLEITKMCPYYIKQRRQNLSLVWPRASSNFDSVLPSPQHPSVGSLWLLDYWLCICFVFLIYWSLLPVSILCLGLFLAKKGFALDLLNSSEDSK